MFDFIRCEKIIQCGKCQTKCDGLFMAFLSSVHMQRSSVCLCVSIDPLCRVLAFEMNRPRVTSCAAIFGGGVI